MTISNFKELPYTDKIHILYNDAVYVGKLKINNKVVVLYQLHHFYIEIVYVQYRNLISSIYITDNVDILTPYLEQIDVKELIVIY